ncbi:DUF7521 family protein [Natronococcus jeotgali]|uniref:Uncharacterized protein n=1 Tax=Natronococcus jeotgali DSM 18795 TaxID=1227498 RepID=L9WSG2_9EURY|nr:hypothetical protein C492_19821 [Natronococcus jeotgali DSM 18795]
METTVPGAEMMAAYGAKLVVVALSLTIAYLAFHGYRQSGSEPMLYVSGGFVFIGTGAVCERMLYELAGISVSSAGLVQATLVSAGMLLILFSLRSGP